MKSNIKQEYMGVDEKSFLKHEVDRDVECQFGTSPSSDEIEVKTEPLNENLNHMPIYKEPDDPLVKGNFVCDHCKQSFKSRCKLRVHWKKTHLLEYLKCEFCKRTFKSVLAFNKHKTNKTKFCLYSNEVHIEGEGKERVFYCKVCSYKTTRIKDSLTHMTVHNGKRPYQCNLCLASYTQQSSLHSHQEYAHKLYKKEITCQYCGKHVKGKTRAYRHLKSHSGVIHQCNVCNKIFKTKQYLNVHKVRHTGIKKYACEACPAVFYSVAELSNHKRNVHLKLRRKFKCNFCQYKTNVKSSIIKHESKHADDNHPCVDCGKFFDNPQKLDEHKQRHWNKKFSCNYCFLRFAQKRGLRKHIDSKHSENIANKKEDIKTMV